MPELVKVQMLGTFSLTCGDVCVDDSQNRSKKVWALLAVLLCNHGRVVRQQELMDLLWGEERESANPVSALKTTLHRARTMLEPLSRQAGGQELILSLAGGYAWNEKVPMELDIESFENGCKTVQKGTIKDNLLHAVRCLDLYHGPFLKRLGSESWVIPRSAYYHNLYLKTVGLTLEAMQSQSLWEQAAQLCYTALRNEPYEESLYQQLMRSLLALGRQSRAVSVYEDMSRLLLKNFGVMPDQESRRLYREALRTVNRQTVPVGVIQEQLRENSPITGALVCDYDFFKMIYQAEARMVERSGNAVHIALLSLSGFMNKALSRRSLETAMENLQEVIRLSLRKGDVVAQCSPSQFVILLPQANYENSLMVCQRILKAFSRQYPHSPATIQTMVYPLEPATGIPEN